MHLQSVMRINNNVIDPQMKLISNEEIFSDIEPAGT